MQFLDILESVNNNVCSYLNFEQCTGRRWDEIFKLRMLCEVNALEISPFMVINLFCSAYSSYCRSIMKVWRLIWPVIKKQGNIGIIQEIGIFSCSSGCCKYNRCQIFTGCKSDQVAVRISWSQCWKNCQLLRINKAFYKRLQIIPVFHGFSTFRKDKLRPDYPSTMLCSSHINQLPVSEINE